jgi:Ca-activated chloride channel family protein
MMPNTQSPLVLLTPRKPALIEGVAQKLPVLVRIQAPDAQPGEKKERKPYHLSLVIDRSGSMSGAPLAEAVRCARHIIDRLAATDLASLMVFDDRVQVLADARPVGDRKVFHAALAQVNSGGSTNLHGGWRSGSESILPQAAEAALARVILLSDGNANVGETTDTKEIATLCAYAAAKGVSTSTYGLGRDFNEDLMVAMAKMGQGNHYYGDTAADLFEPFAEEFDLISSLYARHVKLSLAAPQGVKITLLNDYPIEERDGFPVIRLPDIPFGAEAWVLLELEIQAGLALESGNQILQAGVTANTPEGEPIAFPDQTLVLKALSPAAWDAVLPDPLVVAREAELAAAKLLENARAAAEVGDWAAIEAMLAEARRKFADHPWVSEILEQMAEIAKEMDGARFRKEALYSSGKMRSRLSAKDEMLGSLSAEASSASYLRRKKSQGKAQFPDQDGKQ